MATSEITHITSGVWAGEKVRILKTEQIGPRVWCTVEKVSSPGYRTQVQRAHLSAWSLLEETRRLLTRAKAKNLPRAGVLANDVARLEAMFA